jgi:hypothetical protein
MMPYQNYARTKNRQDASVTYFPEGLPTVENKGTAIPVAFDRSDGALG